MKGYVEVYSIVIAIILCPTLVIRFLCAASLLKRKLPFCDQIGGWLGSGHTLCSPREFKLVLSYLVANIKQKLF